MNNTIFIVDTYSPYLPRTILDAVRYTFFLNDVWYAIYEISTASGVFDWPRPMDEAYPPEFRCFYSYNEAYLFVLHMKKLNK